MKKHLLLLTLLLFVAESAFAVEVEIGGLWYELLAKAKEAKVIQYKNNQKYYGNIVIPESVEHEGKAYSVTSIEYVAFSGCSSLTSVIIPNSVTSIGYSAFSYCSGLISVTIPNSVTSIGNYTFSSCSSLPSVTIPNSVTSIGEFAFFNCSSLTSVTIPNSVTSIGGGAFRECSGLIFVIIGSGIKTIGSQAFAKCAELADVYCYAVSVPSTTSDAFMKSCMEYATLHVPAVSLDAFKTTEPWSSFKAVVALDGTTPGAKKCASPAISYQNGKLSFSCDTEGADFVYEITDADIKKGVGAEVILTTTYHVSVYATKDGYENSDVVTEEIKLGGGGIADVNGDGVVNVADMVAVANIILQGGNANSPKAKVMPVNN